MSDLILKPIYLDDEGVFARLPDGALINASGVFGPIFSVGGKSVALSDASAALPGEEGITFQKLYTENAKYRPVAFQLQVGKNFAINDADNSPVFYIDAETGKVTITSDLEVLGETSTVNTTITDTDSFLISPAASSTTALRIEPDAGVTPIVDIFTIRRTFGSPAVFKVDKDGNVIATQNLTVNGLINGINLSQLKTTADQHYAGTGSRHTASQIDITAIPSLSGATTVQTALVALVDNVTADIATKSVGYEHTQSTASNVWVVNHNKQTRRVSVVVYDDQWEQVIPGSVKLTDLDTVTITFGSAMAGAAILTTF